MRAFQLPQVTGPVDVLIVISCFIWHNAKFSARLFDLAVIIAVYGFRDQTPDIENDMIVYNLCNTLCSPPISFYGVLNFLKHFHFLAKSPLVV